MRLIQLKIIKILKNATKRDFWGVSIKEKGAWNILGLDGKIRRNVVKGVYSYRPLSFFKYTIEGFKWINPFPVAILNKSDFIVFLITIHWKGCLRLIQRLNKRIIRTPFDWSDFIVFLLTVAIFIAFLFLIKFLYEISTLVASCGLVHVLA